MGGLRPVVTRNIIISLRPVKRLLRSIRRRCQEMAVQLPRRQHKRRPDAEHALDRLDTCQWPQQIGPRRGFAKFGHNDSKAALAVPFGDAGRRRRLYAAENHPVGEGIADDGGVTLEHNHEAVAKARAEGLEPSDTGRACKDNESDSGRVGRFGLIAGCGRGVYLDQATIPFFFKTVANQLIACSHSRAAASSSWQRGSGGRPSTPKCPSTARCRLPKRPSRFSLIAAR